MSSLICFGISVDGFVIELSSVYFVIQVNHFSYIRFPARDCLILCLKKGGKKNASRKLL